MCLERQQCAIIHHFKCRINFVKNDGRYRPPPHRPVPDRHVPAGDPVVGRGHDEVLRQERGPAGRVGVALPAAELPPGPAPPAAVRGQRGAADVEAEPRPEVPGGLRGGAGIEPPLHLRAGPVHRREGPEDGQDLGRPAGLLASLRWAASRRAGGPAGWRQQQRWRWSSPDVLGAICGKWCACCC